MVATHLQGILNPPGQDHAIDWTMEMSDPFALLYHHICTIDGLESGSSSGTIPPLPHCMMAISTKEDVDWISAFFHNNSLFRTFSEVCDFSIQNEGKLLVLQPKHLCTTPDGSLTSLDTQYGSLLTLAKDCNWDTTRAIPQTSH